VSISFVSLAHRVMDQPASSATASMQLEEDLSDQNSQAQLPWRRLVSWRPNEHSSQQQSRHQQQWYAQPQQRVYVHHQQGKHFIAVLVCLFGILDTGVCAAVSATGVSSTVYAHHFVVDVVSIAIVAAYNAMLNGSSISTGPASADSRSAHSPIFSHQHQHQQRQKLLDAHHETTVTDCRRHRPSLGRR